MQQNKLLKTILFICGVFILCFTTSIYIFAWTGPTEDPPGGDVPSIIKLSPDTVQSDASSTPSIWINKTAVANLLDLQAGGVSQLMIGYDGHIMINSGKLSLKEAVAPGASADYGKLYVASADSKLYFKDDSGVEYDLTAPGGASQLPDLSDVTVIAPADDEVLTYELSTGLWKNKPGGAGGGISGSGTSTQIAFFSDATTIGSDSDLYWNNVNKRLGVGTATPGAKLEVDGSIFLDGDLTFIPYNHRTISVGTTNQAFNLTIQPGYNGPWPESGNLIFATGEGTERMRIGDKGTLGFSGANYGNPDQVLTSQGSAATPVWADAGGGGQMIYDAVADASGGGDYTTIQDAIAGGHISIFIKDGSYSIDQVLNINITGLRLYGESREGVQISMPNVHSLTINVAASGVVFENLTIHKSWNTSLVTWSGSNGSIINCSFENRYATAGSYGWPVLSGGFSGMYVENSKFSSTQGYIVWTGGSDNVFIGNIFETTGWGGTLLGLGQNSRVIGNHFFANYVAGQGEYGINSGSGSVIIGNILKGASDMGNYAAISADDSIIKGNIIDGFRDGIWTSGEYGAVVNDNIIKNCGRDGIHLKGYSNSDYTGIECVGNTIKDVGQDGIVATPGIKLVITDNLIYQAGRYGIRGDYDFWQSIISNNNIQRCSGGGIVMDSNENFEDSAVIGNVIHNNGGYAIWAHRIYYSTVMGNIIRYNTNNVIYADSTFNSEIVHNVIY